MFMQCRQSFKCVRFTAKVTLLSLFHGVTLGDLRSEFAVAHASTNFSLWPDYCDCADNFSALIQWTWVAGGGAKPTKMMIPSPPGFPLAVSMSKSGFQLLMDQMFPA